MFNTTLFKVAVMSVLEIIGLFQIRFFAETNNVLNLFQGVLAYLGTIFMLANALRTSDLLRVKPLWDGVSGIFVAIVSYYVLGDRLDSLYEYIGLAMIFGGVFLMQMA